MIIFITVTCIILAIAIIALVLLQQGKGSDLGSAFGGGSSNSMFGALGPSGFLGKLTYILVTIWLILSMALAYLVKFDNADPLFEDISNQEVEQDDNTSDSEMPGQ
jgi:preprotein translocase subunit SecG